MVDIQRFEVTGAGDLASVLDVLTRTVGLAVDTDDECTRRWLDSADGALAAIGGRLEHRVLVDGRAVLVWSVDGRVVARIEDVPRDVPTGVDRLGLPSRLVAALGDRELVATDEVAARVVVLARTDDEGKTVARVVVDRTSSIDGASLPIQLEVVTLRGYESDARVLLDEVRASIALGPTERSVAERLLGGGSDDRLRSTMTAAEGWRSVLRGLTARMSDRFSGVLVGEDPEDLHAFRVAVRRIRTVLRDGADVIEPEARERFRNDFQWLGDVTTPARDADVHVLDHPDFVELLPDERRDDLAPLLDVLLAHRARSHEHLVLELRSLRRARFGMAWAAWLDEDDAWTATVAERSGDPVGAVAAAAIRDAHRRLVRDGRGVRKSSPPVVLHDLRKGAKRLRYLLECFAPVLDADAVETVTAPLRRLQDVLGTFQDSEVQARALHELTATMTDDTSSSMLLATGSVIEHLGRRGTAARKEFAKVFDRFDTRKVERAIDAIDGRVSRAGRGKGRKR